MDNVVWLLPIIFMFHDLEEIIFMEQWIKHLNKDVNFLNISSKISARILCSFKNFRTDTFALSVAIIYILLIFCTALSYYYKFYLLWFSIFCVFTIHLFIHVLQAILIKKYIPALATSIICIPICICIVLYSYNHTKYNLLHTGICIFAVALFSLGLLSILSKIRNKMNSKI